MRFFTTASALLAMTSAAVAQTGDFNPVFTPTELEKVPAGAPFEVTWSAPEKYTEGTISIHLIAGADQQSLQPIADIASGIPNTDETYTWAVDATLGDEALYGLVFKWEADPSIYQFSQPFLIKGDGNGVVTTTTGVKTVTLSEAPTSETTAPVSTTTTEEAEEEPTTTTSVESSAVETTSTWTTTTKPESTTEVSTPPPSTVAPPASSTTDFVPPPPSTTPTGLPENSAVRFGSGSLAIAGGLAIALLL